MAMGLIELEPPRFRLKWKDPPP